MLTMHVQVNPGAILRRIRRPVEEVDPALVPPLVALVHVGEVERCLVRQRDAALVAVSRVGRVAVVPDVDRDLDALLLPLDHVRHRLVLGVVEVAPQDDVLTQGGGAALRRTRILLRSATCNNNNNTLL